MASHVARTKRFGLLAISALFTALTISLALYVRHQGPGLAIDPVVASYFNHHATPPVTRRVLVLTYLGSGPFLMVATIVALGALAWRRQREQIAPLVLTMAGGALLNVVIKHEVHRARPLFDQPIVTLATFSFPSAHAMGSTLFYGWLALMAARTMRTTLGKSVIFGGAAGLVFLIAMTRLYLGLHFVSDVVGGMCAGLAWLTLINAAFLLPKSPMPARTETA